MKPEATNIRNTATVPSADGHDTCERSAIVAGMRVALDHGPRIWK